MGGMDEKNDKRPGEGKPVLTASFADEGELPVGRPYFVMEYVKDLPITKDCDRPILPRVT